METLKTVDNFDSLILKMKAKGFEIQLSSNIKDGISGMRIVMEKDKNFNTERIYKAGYKLSEISNQLKISEIKTLFEVKNAIRDAEKMTSNWKEFRNFLHQNGFNVKLQYKEKFKFNQKNEVQDIWIQKRENAPQKNGLLYQKYDGFPLTAIDSNSNNLIQLVTGNSEISNSNTQLKSPKKEGIAEIASEFLEEFIKPNYVAQNDDQLWKKKRKSR